MGRHKKYFTEEEYNKANRERTLKYYHTHREEIKEYNRLNALKYYYMRKLSTLTTDDPPYTQILDKINEIQNKIKELKQV